MKTRNIILGGLTIGAGIFLVRKLNRVQSTADLLKIEDLKITNLDIRDGNLVFTIDMPVVNPEEQSFSGKIVSVRAFSGGEEIAYSEPGVIPFEIAPGSRTVIQGVQMNVPSSAIDRVFNFETGKEVTYSALIEIQGVRTTFTGQII